jgi:hypothetical protein
MTLINTTSFTAQSSITVNNVFSSTYENYVIDLRLTQNTSTSDGTFTLVNGGTPAASNWGHGTLGIARSGGVLSLFNAIGINQAAPYFYPVLATGDVALNIKLYSPFRTARTSSIAEAIIGQSGFGDNHKISSSAQLNNTTSYEGFRYTASAGTMTGVLRIYGVRS